MDMTEAASYMSYFVATARQAFKINNFNAVFLLVSALGLPAVKALKPAWALLRPSVRKLLAALKSLCSPSSNYAAYRKALNDCAGDPCVPVFQVAIRDVTFVQSAGPWTVGGTKSGDVDKVDLRKVVSVYERVEALLKRTERVCIQVVGYGYGAGDDSVDGGDRQSTVSALRASSSSSAGGGGSGSGSGGGSGKSYRIIMERSDDQCDSKTTDAISLCSALGRMGESAEPDRMGRRPSVSSPPPEMVLPERVPSFLALQDHCTRDLFSIVAESTGESRSSPGATSSSGRGRSSGSRSSAQYYTPSSGSDFQRRLFEVDQSPIKGLGDTLLTPVGRATCTSQSSTGSSSTTRSQPKKDWRSHSRFTVRCSEIQVSYLLASIVHTPIAFTSLMKRASAAAARYEVDRAGKSPGNARSPRSASAPDAPDMRAHDDRSK
jgi:uncharacterized membrane protein YgcG